LTILEKKYSIPLDIKIDIKMIPSELNCKLSGLSILVLISYIWVQEKKRNFFDMSFSGYILKFESIKGQVSGKAKTSIHSNGYKNTNMVMVIEER
jgi:hypothetical protein